jgi:hypothetical protein
MFFLLYDFYASMLCISILEDVVTGDIVSDNQEISFVDCSTTGLAGKEQGVIGMNTFNGDPKLGGKRHL